METSLEQTTRLLRSVARGEDGAADRFLPVVYDELHAIARRMMPAEGAQTLQPTVLIHEAYLRLVDQSQASFADRVHFVRVAARAMRYALLDHVKRRHAEKRGGGFVRVEVDADLLPAGRPLEDIQAIHESLERLQALDPSLAEIVELRFFGGMPHAEIAEATGSSERSVRRGWQAARAWLSADLGRGDCRPSGAQSKSGSPHDAESRRGTQRSGASDPASRARDGRGADESQPPRADRR